MEDTALVEIAIGGVAHRGNVIPYNQMPIYVANKHKTTFKKVQSFIVHYLYMIIHLMVR